MRAEHGQRQACSRATQRTGIPHRHRGDPTTPPLPLTTTPLTCGSLWSQHVRRPVHPGQRGVSRKRRRTRRSVYQHDERGSGAAPTDLSARERADPRAVWRSAGRSWARDPAGARVQVRTDFGPTTSYGEPAVHSLVPSETQTPFRAAVSGLRAEPWTAVAITDFGTFLGPDTTIKIGTHRSLAHHLPARQSQGEQARGRSRAPRPRHSGSRMS